MQTDMIAISNQHRDDILRYLDLLCEAYDELGKRDTRSYNVCRRARILRKELMKKQPIPASVLSEQVKNSRAFK